MVDHAGILMEQGKSMACERVCGVNDNIEKAHYHSYYEIYYMEAGERHFVINNQPYFARQGDFVLFSPYIMHCAYSGKDIAFKRILICFREHEISSEELREKLSAGTGIYRMDAKSNKRMHFLMEMFMEEQDRAGEYRGLPDTAMNYHGDAIASTVIGGTSFTGGIGTAPGTFIGSVIMGIISNILNLTGVQSYVQNVVKGLIIIGAVAMDLISKNRVNALNTYLKIQPTTTE